MGWRIGMDPADSDNRTMLDNVQPPAVFDVACLATRFRGFGARDVWR